VRRSRPSFREYGADVVLDRLGREEDVAAISSLVWPSAMRGRISRSRAVSPFPTSASSPFAIRTDAFHDHSGDLRIEQRLAAPDSLKRAHELGGSRFASARTPRPGNDGAEYVGLVGRTCQEYDLHVRELLPHQPAGLDPGRVGQANVHSGRESGANLRAIGDGLAHVPASATTSNWPWRSRNAVSPGERLRGHRRREGGGADRDRTSRDQYARRASSAQREAVRNGPWKAQVTHRG